MPFKSDWEKTNIPPLLWQHDLEQMVRLAYPAQKLRTCEWIAGGCANLNSKIQLEAATPSQLLRIYLRDPDACYREQKLGQLLKGSIPIPQTYYIGEMNGYHFALTEFMPGIPLRDLLLSNQPHDITAIMKKVGEILVNIAAHDFPQSGFFDKNLNIISSPAEDYCAFAESCLQAKTVSAILAPDSITQIQCYLNKYGYLLNEDHSKQLVHADFDPANILVAQMEGTWQVSAILDWEFSFVGSPLWDIANMLRYAHEMPPTFKNAFLAGMIHQGFVLPEHWELKVHLLNLLSLLDCLQRADPLTTPKQCADIDKLMHYILSALAHSKDHF